jgi:Fur family ferric uptake transcriptional regulator
MSHQSIDYAGRIRAHGYRMTPQREIVLDAVCAGEGHTTIDAICARVHERAPVINRSTVYRTLEFLQQLNLVVAADIHGQTIYEIAQAQPHHHLACLQCGDEIEISNDELEATYAEITERYGFDVEVDHLVLYGFCQGCRAHKAQNDS